MSRNIAPIGRGTVLFVGGLMFFAGCTAPRAAGQTEAPPIVSYPPPPGYPQQNQSYPPRVDNNVVPASATDAVPGGPYPGAPPAQGPYPQSGPAAMSSNSTPPSSKKIDDDDGWDISHLAPDYTWKQFKIMIGWGPDEKIARAMYQEGQTLFQQKKYDEAVEKFYTASWRWPESSLEEDALFFLAESYFFTDQYGKAQDAYANLLKQHDNTRYLDTVMAREFAIARYWEQLDEKSHHWPTTPNVTDKTQPLFDTLGNAMGCYSVIRLHDPTGPLADLSIMATANIHFRRGEWEEAAYHYDLIRRDYPKSRFQKEAHLLALESYKHIYQGARYNEEPLKKQKVIAEQAIKQFAGQLGPEEARVREAEARIAEERAEREWMMAQFYDSKKEYGAARYYYNYLVNNYSRTNFAEKSRARLQEIKDLPDSPPDYFKWLRGALHEK